MSDVPEPIAVAARHRLQDRPNLLAIANSRHEDEINNVSTRGTRNTHSCLDRQKARNQVITKEHIYNLTPTTNMEELAKYRHQSVCSPPKNIIPPRNLHQAIQVLPRLDLSTDQQASPANYSDGQGPHDPSTKWCSVNTAQLAGNHGCAAGRQCSEFAASIIHSTRRLYVLLCGPWRHDERYHLHQPLRPFSSHIILGYEIYFCGIFI